MEIKFVHISKYAAVVSLIIIIAGLIALGVQGLNYGIDFAGGAIIYANLGQKYDISDVQKIVSDAEGEGDISYAGDKNQDVVIRMKLTDNHQEIEQEITQGLKDKYSIANEDINIDMVGPSVGKALTLNAIKSILIAWGLILVYVWIRFELKSGVAAIVALIHDVLIMFSFVVLTRMQVNSSFVAAILTIVGYSINDTIVVFDRIRENTKRYGRKSSKVDIVNKSINEMLPRTLNTSLTTLFTITVVYVLGVQSIKEFSLPLIIGLISGTYSSIFIAGPLWAVWGEDADEKLAVSK
ncbi:protein translocase subunit SecF [Xylanivirga thermophila]|uniref:protein translocase subunit SecF n=1 Tax=Xylanivirga thermophila TaxID=2496273 RepID=UPI00101CDBAE|nr:protein translocase subunit SecF [Xylanivirga thermophila]